MAADLIQDTPTMNVPLGYKDNGDGSYSLMVSSTDGGGGGPAVDREIVFINYRVKTAFTGASVGDAVTQMRVVNLSTETPVIESTTWYNDTTGAALAGTPNMANLEPGLVTGGITNAQMAALLSGMATAALQTTGNTSLASILAKLSADPATQTTLAALKTRADLLATEATLAAMSAKIPALALPAGTNRSGTIAAGGSAQPLAAANAARRQLTGQNISNGDLWFNETGAAAVIGAAGSFRVPAGASFAVSTNQAISVIGATTGQAWTATEF